MPGNDRRNAGKKPASTGPGRGISGASAPGPLPHASLEGDPVPISFLNQVRERRDHGAVARTLDALKQGAAGSENTMPLILDCVKAYCTVGEISDALRDVYGTYEEPAVF